MDDFETLSHCNHWIPLAARILDYKDVSGKLYPVLELIDTSQGKVCKTFLAKHIDFGEINFCPLLLKCWKLLEKEDMVKKQN